MKFFLSFLFLVIFNIKLYANSCEETYQFEFPDGKKQICLLDKEKVLVSQDCLRKKKCQALLSLKEEKLKKIVLKTSELEDGKSPATLLCKKLEGKLVLAKSDLGHEEFFCEFSDKSMISTSSQHMIYQKTF